jgi:hypothetical protein
MMMPILFAIALRAAAPAAGGAAEPPTSPITEIDVGTSRIVDTGKVSSGARDALDKALFTVPDATAVTIILCIGNAPQAPLDRAGPAIDELSKIVTSLQPKLTKSTVARALDPQKCPTGVRVAMTNYDARGALNEARATAVLGQVVAHTRDGRDVPLFKDSVIPEHSEIRTPAGARISVLLPDGTRVTVRENSQLALDTLSKETGANAAPSKLKLIAGKFWSAFTKAVGHNLDVETPNAVAGVRGTDFQVGVLKDANKSNLAVYDGKVGINAAGKGTEVPAGYAIVAKEKLGDMRKLPPAPENLLPRQGRFKAIGHVRWDPVQKAVGYRLEVARDVTFTDIFLDARFVGNKIRIDAPPGVYYWRVFARDDEDIESAPSKLYAIEFTAAE